ncbi:MAG: SPOR domain-containing protein [Burkholderiales bacterium]|nr:SPOR domain-containing protein [Burkholderiales bacterium]
MQPKYTHNKSNIIKITEDAKRKSRHRLIGSIVLLFFALVVLLNVTAKVKPIPINPEVVEIKNDASATLAANANHNASAPLIATNSSAPIASAPVAAIKLTESTAVAATVNMGNGFKAGVVSTESKHSLPLQGTISQTPQTTKSIELTSEKPKAKVNKAAVNPADILDAIGDSPSSDDTAASPAPVPKKKTNTTSSTAKASYIQFAALSSQDKAEALQQSLAAHGINATIKPIQTAKGTLYRLRAGPFERGSAEQKLQSISGEGYTGIVTGN